MKKVFILAAIAMTSMTASAQLNLGNLGKVVSGAVGKATGNETASNVLGSLAENLLGTASVSKQSLVGTWTYSKPCTALQSENTLANLGGTLVNSQIENKMDTYLGKVGMKAGKVVLTFNEDGTLKAAMNGKSVSGKWSVEGNTLTLSKGTVKPISVKCNVKLTNNTLQISVESKKVMSFINTIANATSSMSSTASAVGGLLKNYDGVQLGMKFTK